MKFLTKRKSIIKELAQELAYLQIRADWWFYIANGDKEENRNMSSSQLDLVTEVKEISNRFGIINEVYAEAYKIYDFRNSGKKDFVPDIELIKKLDREFCKPRKKTRVFV